MDNGTKYTCGIIDDEVFAIETIKFLLTENFPSIQILWTASSFNQASERLDLAQPDFIFLDIELSGRTGFELLTDYPNRNFEVIFVTAYSQYAIQAFRHNALDYLVKPINFEELQESIKRVINKIQDKKAIKGNQHETDFNNTISPKIVVTSNDSYLYIKADELVYIEGEGSYSVIHCKDGKKYTVSKSLGEMEAILDLRKFFRTHKSQIVAIDHVCSYNKAENYITLSNGAIAMLSRRIKNEFLNLMNQNK